jgi:hypothetical protein
VRLGVAVSGCNTNPLLAPSPIVAKETRRQFDAQLNRDVDIVFLIDNSSSMEEEQANLKRNFPRFIEVLRSIQGGLPNVNIAVITSDFGQSSSQGPFCRGGEQPPYGDFGQFRTKSRPGDQDCGLGDNKTFIQSWEGESVNNLGGRRLEDAFSCIASQGTAGCGLENQLQSLRVALYDPTQRQTFLRPNAYLAIILITDEDDCSVEQAGGALFDDTSEFDRATEWESFRCAKEGHACRGQSPERPGRQMMTSPLGMCESDNKGRLADVQRIIADIKALKKNPGNIMVSAIMGWPTSGKKEDGTYGVGMVKDGQGRDRWDLLPVCTLPTGGGMVSKAYPGLRIEEFVKGFGGTLHSICQQEFSGALMAIGERVKLLVQGQCIDSRLVDMSPGTQGLQAVCEVRQINLDAPNAEPVALTACSANGNMPPCWNLTPDPMCGSGFKVDVNRGPTPPTERLSVIASCEACGRPDQPGCR